MGISMLGIANFPEWSIMLNNWLTWPVILVCIVSWLTDLLEATDHRNLTSLRKRSARNGLMALAIAAIIYFIGVLPILVVALCILIPGIVLWLTWGLFQTVKIAFF